MAKKSFLIRAQCARILSGVNTLAHAVRVTLGPKGRNVVIEKKFGAPTITKDGVTATRKSTLRTCSKTWVHSSRFMKRFQDRRHRW
ncbi:MAG: hypothetical protein R3E66_24085 [bacterium]